MSDAVDTSDCYGANLIDILKFQIQIFYICQKINVVIIIYIYFKVHGLPYIVHSKFKYSVTRGPVSKHAYININTGQALHS